MTAPIDPPFNPPRVRSRTIDVPRRAGMSMTEGCVFAVHGPACSSLGGAITTLAPPPAPVSLPRPPLSPPQAAPGGERARIALGIDGALLTGLGGVWVRRPHLDDTPVALRGAARPFPPCTSNMNHASWTEQALVDRLDQLLGDAEWFAVLEKPWGMSRAVQGRTRTTPPSGAIKVLQRVLAMLARQRATRAGVRYRAPTILRFKPAEWRRPLGIRTAGDVKGAALAYVREVLGASNVTDHNAAEGLCLAEYGRKVAPILEQQKKLHYVR